MRMFITSKNKFLSNDMKIFGTSSIPLTLILITILWVLVLLANIFQTKTNLQIKLSWLLVGHKNNEEKWFGKKSMSTLDAA